MVKYRLMCQFVDLMGEIHYEEIFIMAQNPHEAYEESLSLVRKMVEFHSWELLEMKVVEAIDTRN